CKQQIITALTPNSGTDVEHQVKNTKKQKKAHIRSFFSQKQILFPEYHQNPTASPTNKALLAKLLNKLFNLANFSRTLCEPVDK
ncbi:MAG: hypothetical protein RLN85_19010, partial [Pseudomonadales bacterium]